MKKWILVVGAIGALIFFSDFGKEFRVNNAAAKYRQTCFGDITNRCVSLRIKTNIKVARYYLDVIDDRRDLIVSEIGEQGYSALVRATNEVIELNKQDRPGWFSRTFLKDAQSFKAPNFSFYNDLYAGVDYQIMYREIYRVYGGSTDSKFVSLATGNEVSREDSIDKPENEILALEDMKKNIQDNVNENNRNAGTIEERFEESIDAHIDERKAYFEGSEYEEGRIIVFGDLNGNGTAEAVVVYTIEGAGGSNSYFQSIAAFSAETSIHQLGEAFSLPFSVQNVEIMDGRVVFKGLEHGPNDPNCCPSINRQIFYRLDGDELVPMS